MIATIFIDTKTLKSTKLEKLLELKLLPYYDYDIQESSIHHLEFDSPLKTINLRIQKHYEAKEFFSYFEKIFFETKLGYLKYLHSLNYLNQIVLDRNYFYNFELKRSKNRTELIQVKKFVIPRFVNEGYKVIQHDNDYLVSGIEERSQEELIRNHNFLKQFQSYSLFDLLSASTKRKKGLIQKIKPYIEHINNSKIN